MVILWKDSRSVIFMRESIRSGRDYAHWNTEWAWSDHAEAIFVQLKISGHLRLLSAVLLLLSSLPFPSRIRRILDSECSSP